METIGMESEMITGDVEDGSNLAEVGTKETNAQTVTDSQKLTPSEKTEMEASDKELDDRPGALSENSQPARGNSPETKGSDSGIRITFGKSRNASNGDMMIDGAQDVTDAAAQDIITLSSDSESDTEPDTDCGSDELLTTDDGDEDEVQLSDVVTTKTPHANDKPDLNVIMNPSKYPSITVYSINQSGSESQQSNVIKTSPIGGISVIKMGRGTSKRPVEVISLSSDGEDTDLEVEQKSLKNDDIKKFKNMSDGQTSKSAVVDSGLDLEGGDAVLVPLEFSDKTDKSASTNIEAEIKQKEESETSSRSPLLNVVSVGQHVNMPVPMDVNEQNPNKNGNLNLVGPDSDSSIGVANGKECQDSTKQEQPLDAIKKAEGEPCSSKSIGADSGILHSVSPAPAQAKKHKTFGSGTKDSIGPNTTFGQSDPHKLAKSGQNKVDMLGVALKVRTDAIRKMGELEVDLDDDNSAFVGIEQLRKQTKKYYKAGAEGCNVPPKCHLHFRIPSDLTRQPMIDGKVEAFMNSPAYRNRRIEGPPEYQTILELVKKAVSDNSLDVQAEVVAESLLKYLIQRIKKYRGKQIEENLNEHLKKGEEVQEDPAEMSPELKKKLAANKLAADKAFATTKQKFMEDYVHSSQAEAGNDNPQTASDESDNETD